MYPGNWSTPPELGYPGTRPSPTLNTVIIIFSKSIALFDGTFTDYASHLNHENILAKKLL